MSGTGAIDCLVHPIVRTSGELRGYLREPYQSRQSMADVDRYWYPNPIGEFHPSAKLDKGYPGSDPAVLRKHLFTDGGSDAAVLVPLTRGLMPDAEFGSAICAATNDWLAQVWLGTDNADGRFKGSIRINPLDPQGAAREIERWAGNPAFVQIALPLQVHQPYGQRAYLPIWDAAVRAKLPVMIYSDVSAGVEFWPTAIGYPRHFIEFAMMHPYNAYFHLVSFICEGVFDRHESLRVIFGDPGFSIVLPIMWRLDKGWRSLASDTPWAKHLPSEYIERHVRFASNRYDGPTDPAQLASWLRASRADKLLLFGSNYPYWDYEGPVRLGGAITDDALRGRVLRENARDLYRLA